MTIPPTPPQEPSGRSRAESRSWIVLLLLGLAAGLALRIDLVSITRTPGTSDPAFYYTVAKSLAEGRGLVIDYVAFYFNGLAPLTHYSNDYWLPLASILMSLPMRLFGSTVTSALMASVAAGLVPPLVGFFVGVRVHQSKLAAASVFLLTFLSPIQVTTSVETDSIIFFGAFGSLALLFVGLGRKKTGYYYLAAVCTGLASMIRQDGVLLLGAAALTIFFTQADFKKKIALIASVAAIHILIMSPMLINNYQKTGSVISSGLSKTLFLTKYEDMYAYGKTSDWQSYRAELGLKKILTTKLEIAGFDLEQFIKFLDPVLAILALLGLLELIRLKKSDELTALLPAAALLGLGYFFYSCIWSIHGPGSFYKSLVVLMPFLSLMIVSLIHRTLKPTGAAIAVVALISAYAGYQGYQQAHQFSTFYNQVYAEYRQMSAIVLADASHNQIPPQEVVVIAREPWDINAATGLKSVMIPDNDLETIYFVARHYQARYLLLPAPRPALDKIYTGLTPDPRFTFIAEVPGTDWKVYRISQ